MASSSTVESSTLPLEPDAIPLRRLNSLQRDESLALNCTRQYRDMVMNLTGQMVEDGGKKQWYLHILDFFQGTVSEPLDWHGTGSC